MVTKLSVILNVPPSRLMLLREELELPTQSTVSELGLGIADIIGGSHDKLLFSYILCFFVWCHEMMPLTAAFTAYVSL